MPKIETTSNAFKVTLPNRNAAVPRPSVPVGPESKVMAYLKKHKSITRKDVDALLHTSQATSSRILKRMISEGLICQEGGGRKTRYLLKQSSPLNDPFQK